MDFDWTFELDFADARRSGQLPATAFERHCVGAYVANAIARISVSAKLTIPRDVHFWIDTWGPRLGLIPPKLPRPGKT